ncbi:g3408 [Coccomyxa elongata]
MPLLRGNAALRQARLAGQAVADAAGGLLYMSAGHWMKTEVTLFAERRYYSSGHRHPSQHPCRRAEEDLVGASSELQE